MVEAQPIYQEKSDSQLWIYVARVMSIEGLVSAPDSFVDEETGALYTIQDGQTWKKSDTSKLDD